MDFDYPLPTGWQWVKVADVQAPVRRATITGPFGSSIGMRFFVEKGVPVIRGNNLTADLTKFIDDGFVFVSEEKAKDFEGYLAKKGDIIFTAAGTLGQVGIIPKRARHPVYIISNKQMRARFDQEKIEPDYAYYWFAQPAMVEYIRRQDTGSTIPLINLSVLRSLPIALPPLAEQREIVSTLKSLDDKIELNIKTNATLEQIGRALFRSWFVDFDPIRAKVAGREPEGMDSETAALFPSEFESYEIGLIPKGWKVGELRDICYNYREAVNPAEVDPDTPYIGLEHMPRKSISLDKWSTASQVESGKSRFRDGDILFGKLRPYFHKVGVAPVDGVCSTDILVIRPIAKDYFGVAVSHLSSIELINHADKLSNGAKMPRTKWEDLASYKIVIPPSNLAMLFSEFVILVTRKIRENVLETKVLSSLRDMLLPRLISGQIRIPHIELGGVQ